MLYEMVDGQGLIDCWSVENRMYVDEETWVTFSEACWGGVWMGRVLLLRSGRIWRGGRDESAVL